VLGEGVAFPVPAAKGTIGITRITFDIGVMADRLCETAAGTVFSDRS